MLYSSLEGATFILKFKNPKTQKELTPRVLDTGLQTYMNLRVNLMLLFKA